MSIYLKIALLIIIFVLGFAYSEYDSATECEELGYTILNGAKYDCTD